MDIFTTLTSLIVSILSLFLPPETIAMVTKPIGTITTISRQYTEAKDAIIGGIESTTMNTSTTYNTRVSVEQGESVTFADFTLTYKGMAGNENDATSNDEQVPPRYEFYVQGNKEGAGDFDLENIQVFDTSLYGMPTSPSFSYGGTEYYLEIVRRPGNEESPIQGALTIRVVPAVFGKEYIDTNTQAVEILQESIYDSMIKTIPQSELVETVYTKMHIGSWNGIAIRVPKEIALDKDVTVPVLLLIGQSLALPLSEKIEGSSIKIVMRSLYTGKESIYDAFPANGKEYGVPKKTSSSLEGDTGEGPAHSLSAFVISVPVQGNGLLTGEYVVFAKNGEWVSNYETVQVTVR